jgi:hypothetical protein
LQDSANGERATDAHRSNSDRSSGAERSRITAIERTPDSTIGFESEIHPKAKSLLVFASRLPQYGSSTHVPDESDLIDIIDRCCASETVDTAGISHH